MDWQQILTNAITTIALAFEILICLNFTGYILKCWDDFNSSPIPTDQLAKLPVSILRAIAQTKNIKLGNRKQPQAIARILGTVKLSEIPSLSY